MVFNLCLKNNKVKRVWICRDLTDIKYYMFNGMELAPLIMYPFLQKASYFFQQQHRTLVKSVIYILILYINMMYK